MLDRNCFQRCLTITRSTERRSMNFQPSTKTSDKAQAIARAVADNSDPATSDKTLACLVCQQKDVRQNSEPLTEMSDGRCSQTAMSGKSLAHHRRDPTKL